MPATTFSACRSLLSLAVLVAIWAHRFATGLPCRASSHAACAMPPAPCSLRCAWRSAGAADRVPSGGHPLRGPALRAGRRSRLRAALICRARCQRRPGTSSAGLCRQGRFSAQGSVRGGGSFKMTKGVLQERPRLVTVPACLLHFRLCGLHLVKEDVSERSISWNFIPFDLVKGLRRRRDPRSSEPRGQHGSSIERNSVLLPPAASSSSGEDTMHGDQLNAMARFGP